MPTINATYTAAGYGDTSVSRATSDLNTNHDATEVEWGRVLKVGTQKESVYLVFGPLDISPHASNMKARLTIEGAAGQTGGNKQIRVALLKHGIWNQASYSQGNPTRPHRINVHAYEGGSGGTRTGTSTDVTADSGTGLLTSNAALDPDIMTYGQSFADDNAAGYPHDIDTVQLNCMRVSTRTATVWAEIWTVSPTTGIPIALSATSTAIAFNDLPTGLANVDFNFPAGSRHTVASSGDHIHVKLGVSWTDSGAAQVLLLAGFMNTEIPASSGWMLCYTAAGATVNGFSGVGYYAGSELPYISEAASDTLRSEHFGNVLGPVLHGSIVQDVSYSFGDADYVIESPPASLTYIDIALGAEVLAWLQSADYALGGNDYIALTIDPYDTANSVLYSAYAEESVTGLPIRLDVQYDVPGQVRTRGAVVRDAVEGWSASGKAVGHRGADSSEAVEHAGADADEGVAHRGADSREAVAGYPDTRKDRHAPNAGIPITFPQQTSSLHFDGSTAGHFLHSDGDETVMGFDQAFCFMIWFKAEEDVLTDTLFRLEESSLINGVWLQKTAAEFSIFVSETGAGARTHTFGALTVDAWQQIVVRHDGDAPTMDVWLNGVLQTLTPVFDTGNLFTDNMAAGLKQTSVGGNYISPTQTPFPGLIHSAAVWRQATFTQAAVDFIYNSGNGSAIDLNTDSGAYTYSNSGATNGLRHWWRFGLATVDASIGLDYCANGEVALHPLPTLGGGMSVSDLVADYPGM